MAQDFNQVSLMLAELNKRLAAVPFVPFLVVMSNGKSYPVPTSDHLTITRLLRQVTVESDDCTAALINPLHITAFEPLGPMRKAG